MSTEKLTALLSNFDRVDVTNNNAIFKEGGVSGKVRFTLKLGDYTGPKNDTPPYDVYGEKVATKIESLLKGGKVEQVQLHNLDLTPRPARPRPHYWELNFTSLDPELTSMLNGLNKGKQAAASR